MAGIGQGFDDATFGNATGGTFLDHSPQLRSDGTERCDAPFDLVKTGFGDPVGCVAGLVRMVLERQESPDRFQVEAELTGMSDEGKPWHGVAAVSPLLSFGARRRRQKSDLFVVPDRRHLYFGAAGKFANRKIHHKPLEPIATIGSRVLSIKEHAMPDHCCDHENDTCCTQAAPVLPARQAAADHCVGDACGCSGGVPVFDGVDARYKRVLWTVIALNGVMFLTEMAAGQLAGSQALKADALDFLGDTVTYGLSLAVIGASLRIRASAALFKGLSLSLMALWVFGSTIYRAFVLGLPSAEVMGLVGFLALAANLTSVLLLRRYKDGDANVRSVWLCSRNDAIGNVVVMVAAMGVWGTATAWPDLAVAVLMAGIFLSSSMQILRQAWGEYREEERHSQPVAAE